MIAKGSAMTDTLDAQARELHVNLGLNRKGKGCLCYETIPSRCDACEQDDAEIAIILAGLQAVRDAQAAEMAKPELSCLLCGHAKERSTYSATKGCFICVDCIYQHNEYINMVNLAAQERGRAIAAEAKLTEAEAEVAAHRDTSKRLTDAHAFAQKHCMPDAWGSNVWHAILDYATESEAQLQALTVNSEHSNYLEEKLDTIAQQLGATQENLQAFADDEDYPLGVLQFIRERIAQAGAQRARLREALQATRTSDEHRWNCDTCRKHGESACVEGTRLASAMIRLRVAALLTDTENRQT